MWPVVNVVFSLYAFLHFIVKAFEELIQKYILDNTHGAIVVVKPERGRTARLDKELEDKLFAYKASLSEEELSCLAKVYETFKNETPSTISEISHHEAAWLDNIGSHGRIDYDYAFSLKAL